MCLATVARVIDALPGDQARVEIDGVQRVISVALLDDVVNGDLVIVHVGFALSKLDEAQADRTITLLESARANGDAP